MITKINLFICIIILAIGQVNAQEIEGITFLRGANFTNVKIHA